MSTITIDLEGGTVTVAQGDSPQTYALGTDAGFGVVTAAWLRAAWDARHVYSFTWLGRPIIQLPEDLVRAQEAIYATRPDVILETGVAHGGSLVFYASLFRAMGAGRVIGVDIEIRPPNRAAIEGHELSDLITLHEGDSTSPETLEWVRAQLRPGERVMVVLDSNHSRDHVLAELNAYADLVAVGCYLVATDAVMADLAGAPGSGDDWAWNNPGAAITDFLATRSDFVPESPPMAFNEGRTTQRVTYWPGAWLRRSERR